MSCLIMRSLFSALLLVSLASAFVLQPKAGCRGDPLVRIHSRNNPPLVSSSTKRSSFRSVVVLHMNDFKSDFDEGDASGDKYEGSIDWDGEWKKVLANKDQPTERPGKDFYKSETEIAAIKAANKAQEKVVKVASSIPSPSVPTFDSIKGDWRFWVGVLAIVSIGFSVLSASGTATSYNGNSYYI